METIKDNVLFESYSLGNRKKGITVRCLVKDAPISQLKHSQVSISRLKEKLGAD